MPPHCDTLDGPVVQAAKRAIADVHVLHVLPWVPKESEQEVRDAFESVMRAREKGGDACTIADQWFYETVVRLHRMGEGAPYTGLKPAGLDPGLGVRLAEHALKSSSTGNIEEFFTDAVERTLRERMEHVRETAGADPHDSDAMRRHIHAKLSFIHLANELYQVLVRTEHRERARNAESVVKEKLEQSYSKRHPLTTEVISHRHS